MACRVASVVGSDARFTLMNSESTRDIPAYRPAPEASATATKEFGRFYQSRKTPYLYHALALLGDDETRAVPKKTATPATSSLVSDTSGTRDRPWSINRTPIEMKAAFKEDEAALLVYGVAFSKTTR
jgi:hypothetical protein